MLRSEQKFRSEAHNLVTENVNKIALSASDDERLQTLDGELNKWIEWLTLMILQQKKKRNSIQTGRIFLAIHTEN